MLWERIHIMKFLLFGTGDCYERYKKWFDINDIVALLDNSREKQDTYIDGIIVMSPEKGIKQVYDEIVIMSFYVKEMRQQLIGLGVDENKINHFYDLHKLIRHKGMKRPVQYYQGGEEIINPENISGRRILLLSRDMMLGGPAIALFYAAKTLAEHGHAIVFASMEDGPLREKLLELGIPVVVDENLQIETMEETGWTAAFSLFLCNTINFYIFLSKRDVNIPVIWWLHDSSFFYDGVDKDILRSIDRRNLKVYSVGPVPEAAIKEFMPDLSVGRLLYGVEDALKSVRFGQNDTSVAANALHSPVARFVTIGYIERRKGQDILINAIQALPDDIRQQAVFYMVGQNTSVMAKCIKKIIKNIPQVIMTGTVGREEINNILESADVMICPSREDPMPTVAAEAMMHSLPCIISDAAGTADYIKDGVNGFIFQSENVSGLAGKIKWCMENRDELPKVGIKSRYIYDNYFSMEAFEKAITDIMDGI